MVKLFYRKRWKYFLKGCGFVNSKCIRCLLSFVLAAILSISSFCFTAFAAKNVIINGSVSASVTKIIDGDAIEVKLSQSNDTALVKFIGVDAQGYDDAVSFLTGYLLGQTVVLSPDPSVASSVGIWNNMYVTLNGENVNKILIEKGYGITNPSYMSANQFNEYLTVQRTAKAGNIGIWDRKIPIG